IECHGHDVGRRLGPRPLEAQIVAHAQLEGADQPGLDGRHAHLAVALRAMAVADREQRAVDLDWQVERAAGDQLLVVEIAAGPAHMWPGNKGRTCACTAASASGTTRGGGGITSRGPDTVEIVTVSPFSMVSSGSSLASK